jgi:hypothetical protein
MVSELGSPIKPCRRGLLFFRDGILFGRNGGTAVAQIYLFPLVKT